MIAKRVPKVSGLVRLWADMAEDQLVYRVMNVSGNAKVVHLVPKSQGWAHSASLCGNYPSKSWKRVGLEHDRACTMCHRKHAARTHDRPPDTSQ